MILSWYEGKKPSLDELSRIVEKYPDLLFRGPAYRILLGPNPKLFQSDTPLQSWSKSLAGIKYYADGVPGTVYFAKDLYGFDLSKIARAVFGAFTDSDAYDIFAAEEVVNLGPVRARKLK